MSDRNQSWSALIVSNVLLTLSVIACFAVLGWLCSDAVMWFIDRSSGYFPEVLRLPENVRALCVGMSLLAGFIVSQVCFAIRSSRMNQFPAALWPFTIRFQLLSCVLVMLIGAGLLWINVRDRIIYESAGFNQTGRGWPFYYFLSGTWTKTSPDAIDTGGTDTIDWIQSNIFINLAFCLVLLLIVMVVIEFFLSMRKSRPIPELPADPSVKNTSL
jgi:hypothetical protein